MENLIISVHAILPMFLVMALGYVILSVPVLSTPARSTRC